jgi:hypothetical protein
MPAPALFSIEPAPAAEGSDGSDPAFGFDQKYRRMKTYAIKMIEMITMNIS